MQNKTQTSQSSYSPPQRGIMPQTAFYPVYTSSPFGSNYSTALVFVLLSATRQHQETFVLKTNVAVCHFLTSPALLKVTETTET